MASYNFTILPPKIKDRSIYKPLLCGSGPADIWPSVAEALSRPMITPVCDEYYHVLDDIRTGLQYAFQTRSKLVLAVSGAGHCGMEAVITNLVGPGQTLLIASRGMWDMRALDIAKRFGINTIVHEAPMNTTFKIEELEPLLAKHRPVALFITHGDSSTGTIQKLAGLGNICHKYGALLLVDTVVSLGGVPFLMDEWGVDAVYASTQKSLGGPAGISPVACSDLAQKVLNNRKHLPPFYFDLKLLAENWNCFGNTRFYHHTLSPPLLWALRACLKELTSQTLEKSWERHTAAQKHFCKRMEEFNFQFFVPNPEERLSVVTTVTLPKGYDYLEFTKYMRAKHNILIFGGMGPSVGKTLRIGLIALNATKETADIVANAMADTFKHMTKKITPSKHNILMYGGTGPTLGKVLRIGHLAMNATEEISEIVAVAMDDTKKHMTKTF